MPDGTTIQGVPDGVTQSQLSAKYGKFQSAQDPGQTKTLEQTIDPANIIPAVMGAVSSPLINLASKTYQTDKNLFTQNFPNASAAIGSVANKFGSVIDMDKNYINNAINSSPSAQAIVNGPVVQAAKDTAKIAGAVLPAEGVLEDAGAGAAKTLADQAAEKTRLGLQSDQIKEQFTDPAFASARQSGATLSPQATDQALTTIQTKLSRDPKIAPDAADKMIDDMINGGPNTDKWAGDSTDLETLMAKHAELNGLINQAYVSGDNNLARKYTIIRNSLKDTLDNASAEDLTNPAGVDQFRMGNHYFGQQADLNTIESTVNATQNMSQPANSLASRFDKLLNKKNGSFLKTDQERELAQKIASTSSTQELMKVGASRLVDYAAAGIGAGAGSLLGPAGSVGGGVAGAMAGHSLSSAMRDAAWASKMKQVAELKAMILNRDLPEAISAGIKGENPSIAEYLSGKTASKDDVSQQLRANRK